MLANEKRVTCIWIENAKIDTPVKIDDNPYAHANFGHQIENGNLSVLSIRSFEGIDGAVDSQHFSKTTLEVEHLPRNIPVGESVDLNVLRSFHTEGSVGFILKAQYLQSTNPLHAIRIERIRDKFELIVHANFDAIHAATGHKYPLHVDFNCKLEKRAIDDLSPWDGKNGANWKSFLPFDP